ncbi:OsmC family protein [Aegicerativicinus sediminis]|uniref:OsmC family protein n=1 Tax=Aegicerativicinus sediminis TaxID=2893202 RepID=UPI001E6126E8|nr:OsmC family protein [Aegicerativicinus sediminis]
MQNKVVTKWKGNTLFESDNPSGLTLNIDTKTEMGGSGEGLRPKALMLSSLAGCSGLDVIFILKKMRVDLKDFSIDTIGHLTDDVAAIYHTVDLTYHFYGDNLDMSKLEKAVDLSVNKYCGVMTMFRNFATINIQIENHQL